MFSEPEFRESSGEMSRGQRVREQATEKLLQLLYILGACKKERKTDRRGFLDVIGEKEGANKKRQRVSTRTGFTNGFFTSLFGFGRGI